MVSVEMQPLGTEFFLDAMRLRIERFLSSQGAFSLFDPEFLEHLLPNTEPRITTFREVFAILLRMTDHLPVDRNPCLLSGREFAQVRPFEGIIPISPQDQVFRSLLDYVRREYDPARPMMPMDTGALRALSGTEISDEAFESAVVKPLVTVGVLRSIGTPYSRAADMNDRFPPPYLPSAMTFLHARYNGGLI
jgi:hypothetical protein